MKPKQNNKAWVVNTDAGEIKLFGYVGDDQIINFSKFIEDFEALAKTNEKITIRINSNGGCMVNGLAIYDTIRASKVKVVGIVEGMAASIALVIFLACHERLIRENARLMSHRAKATFWGELEGMKGMIELLDQEDAKLKEIFKERTGQNDEVVSTWMSPGVNKWFDAKNAVKFGLADSIISSKSALPDNILNEANLSLEMLVNSYGNESGLGHEPTNQLNNTYNMNTEMNSRQGWSFTDWSKQDPAGLQNMLKNEPNVFNSLYKKEYGSDYFQEREPKKASVNNSGSSPGKASIPPLRFGWTYKEWSQKDPTGLERIMNNDPSLFNSLFKNEYGDDYFPEGHPGRQPTNIVEDRSKWSWRDYENRDPGALLKMQKLNPDLFNKLLAGYKSNPQNASSIIDKEVKDIYYDFSEALRKIVDLMNSRLEKVLEDKKLKVTGDGMLEDESENQMLEETVLHQECQKFISEIDHSRKTIGGAHDRL